MARREPDQDAEAALLARAQEAVEDAARIQQESEVLRDLSDALRTGRLSTRCAWCGRYRIGSCWVLVEDMPASARYVATHSICDDCIEALRESGMSV